MAQRGNGFQCHVAASLNRPFVVLFQKDRAHEAEDGGFIGKDPHDIRAPLDLSIETFDRIGGVDLRPVVFRDGLGRKRGPAGLRVFSCSRPSRPCSPYRCCQRQTVGRLTPARRATSNTGNR